MSHPSPPQPPTRSRRAQSALRSSSSRSARRRSSLADAGKLRATWLFLTDSQAPLLAKLVFVLSLVYLVFPIDAIPDLIPVVGYLDDLGFIGVATWYLLRTVRRYQEAERAAAIDTEGVALDR